MLEAVENPKEMFVAELARKLSPASVARCDEPLAKKTTLRVGGPADFYIEPASEDDLAAVLPELAHRLAEGSGARHRLDRVVQTLRVTPVGTARSHQRKTPPR